MFPKRVVAGLSMLTLATVVIVAGEKNCRAQAQIAPNVSGTWELVEDNGTKKSDARSNFPRVTLVISQQTPEIKITQKTIRRGVEEVQEFTTLMGAVTQTLDESLSGSMTSTELSPSRNSTGTSS
jgi:hypothetical protein